MRSNLRDNILRPHRLLRLAGQPEGADSSIPEAKYAFRYITFHPFFLAPRPTWMPCAAMGDEQDNRLPSLFTDPDVPEIETMIGCGQPIEFAVFWTNWRRLLWMIAIEMETGS